MGVFDCCGCWAHQQPGGYYNPSLQPTLFHIYKAWGYAVAAYGKVFGPDPGCSLRADLTWPQGGADFADNEGSAPGCKVGWRKYATCEVPDAYAAAEPDALTTSKAVATIDWLLDPTRSTARPFLVYLGLRRPHLPFNAPKAIFDLYPAAAQTPLAENRDWIEGGLDWDAGGELRNGCMHT